MDINTIKITYKNAFILNAIQRGWSVQQKEDDEYIFSKKHYNKRKYFKKRYLGDFIKKCSGHNNVVCLS